MQGPNGRPPPGRSPLSHAPLRWAIAAAVGVSVTAVLFVAMTRLIDGSWILERLVRVFPLQQTPAAGPCEAWQPELQLVTIEGTVGTLADGAFAALPHAEVIGLHGDGRPVRVDLSATGVFRFVTPFVEPRPETCEDEVPVPVSPVARLLIEAPGCTARSVPVTRSWLPHRVLLDCEEP